MLSEVVTAVLFSMILSPSQGLAGHLTRLIGLGDVGSVHASLQDLGQALSNQGVVVDEEHLHDATS